MCYNKRKEEKIMNDIEKNNRTRNLHNEMHQIIVSKRELYYQFDNFSEQDNLLALFSCKPGCADYNRILNLLGAKFELIGSFNYVSKVGGKEHLKKPHIKTYYEKIFDRFCESPKEIGKHVYLYGGEEQRDILYKKYRATRYYITPMLATINEQNYAAEFMSVLDYIAKNDNFPETTFSSDTAFPEVLREKVKEFDWWEYDIHS